MGCFCSANKVAMMTLSQSLKLNNEKIAELQKKLNSLYGKIETTDSFCDTFQILEEQNQSLDNVLQVSKMLPQHIYKVSENQRVSEVKDYVFQRLERTDFLQKLCKELENLMHRLKEIDLKKSQNINSTIESFEAIIVEESFQLLSGDLESIKRKQIEISSDRGGELQELIERIEQRTNISKELETIQAKIEKQQYIVGLESIPADSQETTDELISLIDKRDHIEKLISLLQTELEVKEKEAEPMRVQKLEIQEKISGTEKEIEDLKVLHKQETDQAKEVEKAKKIIAEANAAIEELKERTADASKEKADLTQILEKSEKLKTKIQSKQNYIDELKIKLLQSSTESLKSDLGFVETDEKAKNLKVLEENISEIEDFSTTLSKNVDQSIKKSEDKLKLQIALRLFYAFKEGLEKCFWKWKQNSNSKNFDSSMNQKSFFLDTIDEEDYKCAESFIEQQVEEDMSTFNVLKKYQDADSVRLMEKGKLFRFLDQVMDKRYEMDTKDLNDGVYPMSMPDFFYNYISHTIGIQKSADKQIQQILFTLKSLSDSNIYAKFYCSLLNISDFEPISLEFAVFLTRARYDFQSLIYKHERLMLTHSKRQNFTSKSQEYLEKGGVASLSDIIDLIVSMFESDRTLGMMALQMLKPDEITLEEFVIFQICQKVARMEKSVEAIFSMVDKDSSNSIDRRELALFTRVSMDVWINDSDLDQCFVKLVKAGSSEISKEVFCTTFNLNYFQEATVDERYLITKDKFLNVLVEIHKKYYRKQCAAIFSVLNMYSNALNKSEFSEIVQFYDKESTVDIEKLFTENAGFGGKISHSCMVSLMLKNGIGEANRGIFSIHELYLALENKSHRHISKSVVFFKNVSFISPRNSLNKSATNLELP